MSDINDIIISYLDGSATPEERRQLEEWLRASQANRDDFDSVRKLWYLSSAGSAAADTKMALSRLLTTIKARQARRNTLTGWRLAMRVAAAAVILLTVGYVSYLAGARNVQTVAPPAMNRLITAAGSKGRFMLPDSSVVWLNSSSTLEYPENFDSDSRHVALTGEAYFEVSRDEKRPFTVSAGDLDVRVLGTHFTVENYSSREVAEVVLVEGSVEVTGHNIDRPEILEPGQLLAVEKSSGHTEVEEVNTGSYTSWIQNKLVFDGAPLEEILLNLSKWYVVDIDCDPILGRRISLSLTVRNGDELSDIIEAMSFVAPITYRWEGPKLIITRKK